MIPPVNPLEVCPGSSLSNLPETLEAIKGPEMEYEETP
jgi:hypothetical protein